MKRIIRVFPRRTNATPEDDLVRVGVGPTLYDEADEVHISVAFTWDLAAAERLAKQWEPVSTVKIGGPATGEKGGVFVPGMYLKHGYVITSRGCPNKCWFCSVWKREGQQIRELPVHNGWNVLDDNLLACSESHIRNVFTMLRLNKNRWPKRRIQLTGGLEAARLQGWHAKELFGLKPKQIFFAYDTPNDYEPMREAGRLMRGAGFTTTSRVLRCYVLCGWDGDTMEAAESRMRASIMSGFTPMAMLYRDQDGKRDRGWIHFAKLWGRPATIHAIA